MRTTVVCMSFTRPNPRTIRARLIAVPMAALLLAVPVTPAAATPPPSPAARSATTALIASTTVTTSAVTRRALQRRRRTVVRFARRQIGKPYRWGGTGPHAYDCSGLTGAAWAKVGRRLPHSSRLQVGATRRVRWRNRRKGDLFFFGRPVHHVAIYVGDGRMIEAPRPGKRVRKVSARRAGRVRVGRP